MTILAAVATALSGTAGASCILVDGSTADRGACRSIYGEAWGEDGVGDHQTLDYFNSIYKWSDGEVSWETWSYEATALRNSGGASLSARTFVDLLDHSEPPASVSTKFGTATYRGHARGVYALATPFGGNVGAVRSDLELTADFTGGELTGTFDGFSILLEAATGDGWQRIPASITVAGSVLKDGFVHTDAGFSLKDGVVGSGQLDSDFFLPAVSGAWQVNRNRVLGLTPELPDLPEFSIRAHFVKDATETVGTLETISPLVVEQGDSTGLLSLSMSFGGDTATMPAPDLTPAAGLHIGEADPDTGAATLSSALRLDNRTDRASIMDNAYIASLSRDGQRGYPSDDFQVTYVIGDVTARIDFSSVDYGADTRSPNTYYKRTAGGDQFWLWSFPDHKSWTTDHYAQYGFFNWLPGGIRGYITDGVGTAANDLPGGSATYNAEMLGEIFDNTVGSLTFSESRTWAYGYLTLTANFADGSVGGRIFNLWLKRPGASSYSNISTTSRFDIDNGRLNEKVQFTAELTGADSDPTASPENTVRGFEGHMLGGFYGPDAAEVAGVFNAKRTGNGLDEEFVGRFGGNKAVGAEAIVTGVNRLVDEGRTVALADDGMARIERTASGWTATVDGQTIEFSENDFNAHPQLTNIYTTEPAAGEGATLWSPTGGFRGSSEFDYFDVKRWGHADLAAGADRSTIEVEDYVSSKIFFAVHGDRTAAAAMPTTGAASYGGRMFAYSWQSDTATLTSGADWYRGKVALTADFADASIAGEISELMSRPAPTGTSAYTSATGGATFNAAISGNRLTAGDLAGTGVLLGFQNGSVEGAFFGPAADEVGGVLSASDAANNRLLMGFFGADRQ